ncbi:MAG: hypothetical protein PHQ96_03910 [Candidatus Omnitrophica bacterium]|nr:hypothetical protein [Candidatus Omnitrophota bacterium]
MFKDIKRKNKLIPVMLVLFLLSLGPLFKFSLAQDAETSAVATAQGTETFTVTNYYPTPYGAHRALWLYPNNATSIGSACTNEGELSYNATDKQVCLCDGAAWQSLSGYWKINGDYLYPSDVNWTVGIGSNTSYGFPLTIKRSSGDAIIVAGSGIANETATFGWSPSNFSFVQGGTWGTSPRNLVLQGGNGTVGIGTPFPDTNYKLDVNGKFRANNVYLFRRTNVICPGSGNFVNLTFPAGQFSTAPIVTCTVHGGTNAASCGVVRSTATFCNVTIGTSDPSRNVGTVNLYVIAVEP